MSTIRFGRNPRARIGRGHYKQPDRKQIGRGHFGESLDRSPIRTTPAHGAAAAATLSVRCETREISTNYQPNEGRRRDVDESLRGGVRDEKSPDEGNRKAGP